MHTVRLSDVYSLRVFLACGAVEHECEVQLALTQTLQIKVTVVPHKSDSHSGCV